VVAAAAALAIIVAGGVTWWVVHDREALGAGRSAPTGCPRPSGDGWHQVALKGRPSATLPDDHGSLTFTVNAASWRLESTGAWQLVLTTQMQNNASQARGHGFWYYRDVRVAQRPFGIYCFDNVGGQGAAPGEIVDARVGFNVTCPPSGSMALVLEASLASSITEDLPFTAATTPGDCTPVGP
jgi:hypothetical protein